MKHKKHQKSIGTIDNSGVAKELRKEIYNVFLQINKNPKNTPKIFEIIITQEGYCEIEAKVIKMVINDGITPSACIPHIESEL